MKKINIIFLLCLLLMISACENVLEEKATNQWVESDVWRVPQMAEGVLMKAYAAIAQAPDNFGGNFMDAATDNALTSSYSSPVYKVAMGGITTSSNPFGNWSTCYEQLQYIHQFLENGLSDDIKYNRVDSVVNKQTKDRLKGEAYFLRAWWSFQLLMQYGGKTDDGEALGYPIITKFITEQEAANPENFSRNTYAECVRQILNDCDTAMAYLPMTYTGSDIVTGVSNVGRASRLSAAVLKSRVALYGASPAYQPDAITLITANGSFSVVNNLAYENKWAYAALVSDSIIQMSGFGNFLGLKAANLADAPNTTPADFVFRKYFNNRAMEGRHFPPFYYGNANTIPSQNLVDAFPAANGYPVTDPRANVDPANPYAQRDSRLDLNVYYQGRMFGTAGKTIDVVSGGRDSREYHASASRSGYYLAKFMSKKNAMLNPALSSNAIHYYPLLRKSEVFLNFAEAANEAWGPKGKDPNGKCKYSAYEVIKLVRSLSGGITATEYLDEMAVNKDLFRQLIQNERRIEFAFENHRYYDMRRCLLKLNEPVKGVEVSRSEGVLSFNVKEIEVRKFDNIRSYYAPIPYEERIKNRNLINNTGW
ncbi:MAG: RagB/SusD family nutrient uptake outer membrane protein [Paludibacter sp.]|nr:RagB/SusD family nutrient uptake outer membrane protein [Paludibacter sp.]